MHVTLKFSALIFIGACVASAKFISSAYVLPGHSSRRSATVAESEFRPAQAPGMVVSNVNIFNGQPSYQIPLMGLQVHGSIEWNLSLTYSGGVQPILDQPNSRSPVGPVGLGWSISMPYVAVDHKGTVSLSDDAIYCDLGPYGGGQIVQNSDETFFLSTNAYIRIFPTISDNQFQSWLFVFPDGNKLYMGETADSKRFQRYIGSKIGSFMTPGKFTYRWDASRFTNFSETSSILFEYSQTMEPIIEDATDEGYTRESQLKKIYWKDAAGEEVESIEFFYGQKRVSEYGGYSVNESRDDLRLYDTHYLGWMTHRITKKLVRTISFQFDKFANQSAEPKRLLSEITDIVNGGSSYSWKFTYDLNNTQMLTRVEKPDHTTENFEYQSLNMHTPDVMSSMIPDTLKDQSGIAIEVPEGNEDKWFNSIYCTQEFCFGQVLDATDENNQIKYLQIYQNSGNYFKQVGLWQFADGQNVLVSTSDKYFIVSNTKDRTIHFFEWNGKEFVDISSNLGSIVVKSNLWTGEIESVFTEENYVLFVTKDGDKRRIYPVLRDASTGKWTVLELDKYTCNFSNISDYGETIRDVNSSSCLEWNSSILVSTTSNMFLVGEQKKDVINVFGMDGSTFTELSANRAIFPYLGIQKSANGVLYTMNFQENLESIQLNGDVLSLEFNDGDGKDITAVCIFDGRLFRYSNHYVWDDGSNKRGPSKFYASGSYMLEVSQAKSNVFLWRKKRVGGRIDYERDNAGIFPFNSESQHVYVSRTTDAFYLESRYENERAVLNDDKTRYHHKLVYVPSDPDKPISDWTSSLDPKSQNLEFSQSDPIVLYETLEYADGNFCGETGLCYSSYYTASRDFSATKSTFWSSINKIIWPGYSVATPRQLQVSPPNRLMARSIVDNLAHRVLVTQLQYTGDNYQYPKNYPVVKKYWRTAETGILDETQNQYVSFEYIPFGGVAEFNTNTLSAQFMSPMVTVKDFTSNQTLSRTEYNFIIDRISEPLPGYLLNTQGLLRTQKQFDASDLKRTYSRSVYSIDSGLGLKWPNGMVQNRTDSVISVSYDYRGSKLKTVTTNFFIDSLSGQPRVSLQNIGDKYFVSQNILESKSFDADGTNQVTFRMPIQQVKYSPLSYNPSIELISKDPANLLYPSNVVSTTKAVYSTSVPYQAISSFGWNARNYNATDADYRLGNVISFRADTGFVLQSSILSRNIYGQPTEVEVPTVSGLRHNCMVYEGKRSLPAAQFVGASCSDVAATTSENGPLLASISLAQNNNWELTGATFDSSQVFDGMYSFKVTDSYGPTRNISLREFGHFMYDYVISGWAYSATSVKPMLIAEFRKADGTILDWKGIFDPIEPFQSKRWQRWELVLTAKQLQESGLFSDGNASGNYLRIWMGTGEPQGNSSRVVYVDNMVAYPSSSSFSLATYRPDGQVLSSTNSLHETYRPVYDKNNRQRTKRDYKGRVFQDNAIHFLHENEGN